MIGGRVDNELITCTLHGQSPELREQCRIQPLRQVRPTRSSSFVADHDLQSMLGIMRMRAVIRTKCLDSALSISKVHRIAGAERTNR